MIIGARQRKHIVWMFRFNSRNLTSVAGVFGGESVHAKNNPCAKHELTLNFEIKSDECFWLFWVIRFVGFAGCVAEWELYNISREK